MNYLDRKEDCRHIIYRTPLILKNIQTNTTITINYKINYETAVSTVWMEYAGNKTDRWWSIGIVILELKQQLENTYKLVSLFLEIPPSNGLLSGL
jgi:hypothetical protein